MRITARCVLASAFILSLPLAAAVASPEAAPAEPLPLLTTAAQVHGLSAEEARRGYPVKLRGVVTFYDKKHFNTCFIHDGEQSVSVLTTGKSFPLDVGYEVEMRGVSDPGKFAPMLKAEECTILGRRELPPPRRATFEDVVTGREDSQWVEFAGVVRSAHIDKSAERLIVEIATGGGRLMGRIRDYSPSAKFDHLIDARISMRGVCSQLFNQKRQMFNVRLLVPGMDDLIIEEPAPSDPYAARLCPIVRVMQFTPDGVYGRRVRVQGVVTFYQPGRALYIRDNTQSLLVKTPHLDDVKPGDRVDVLGFPVLGQWNPILEDATYRKIEPGPVPDPVPVTAERALSGSNDADLVTIDGTVLDRVQRLSEQILVVQADQLIFDAVLEKQEKKRTVIDEIDKGSKVRLTGVCLVDVGDRRVPHAFRLLLRSAGDIVILQHPPWWNLHRLLWSLGAVSLVTLAGWIWLAALGYRVREQTAIIRGKIQREAAFEERVRLAREFHDTLEQQLTGIRLQLDAVKNKFREAPDEAEGYLKMACSLIRHSHADARRSVWDMRSDVLDKGDLPSALRQVLAQQGGPDSAPVAFRVIGAHRQLPQRIENQLLRIAQEASTNAIKHAKAGRIAVELRYDNHEVVLRVEDDGLGFDSVGRVSSYSGGFGLIGMSERAEKIGGTLTIDSVPGQGTVVNVIVPCGVAELLDA